MARNQLPVKVFPLFTKSCAYRSSLKYVLVLTVLLSLLRWPSLILPYPFTIRSVADAQSRGQPDYGGVYRRPLPNEPSTLDPPRINDIFGRTIAEQLYDGLVKFDATLAIRPAIAESWRSSRDSRIWTFYLRRGVKFHHGREVTADDFVYSFTRIVDPRTQSNAVRIFFTIKGANEFAQGTKKTVDGLKAVNKYTLQITLTEPISGFVAALAVGAAKVVPKEVVGALGEEFSRRPIGTGPFKFSSWERNKRIILEANADYFEGRPFLDQIEYRIFPGNLIDQMFVEFEAGNLEDSPIPSEKRSKILESKKYQFIRRPILGISFIAFNTAKKPLDNPLLRQAITHAIDRKAMAEEINEGRFLPGNGILPPGTYGYDPALPGIPYDPDKVRTLLKAAGYPHGKGLPTIQIWSARSFEAARAEHDAIQKHLADVGIVAEFRYNANWPDFKSKAYAGAFQAFRYSWYADTPDPDTFLASLFHSKSPDNTSRYTNKKIDVLINKARNEDDFFHRVKLYQEVEREIVRDAPILVLYYYSYEHIFQNYVKGIQISALGDRYIPMKNIWLEKSSPAAAPK